MDQEEVIEYLQHGQRIVAELNPQTQKLIDGMLSKTCPTWPGLDVLLGAATTIIQDYQEGPIKQRFCADCGHDLNEAGG